MFSSSSSQVSSAVNYIEEVFSTYLYTGTGAALTITNNIDLSTKGGLTWIKGRSGATDHKLTDTARGVTKALVSNSTAAQTTDTTGLTAFGTTGFTLGANTDYNTSAATYVSWTFREQSKFFDVVTYTGTGVNRTVAHNLGSVPGCIIVKDYASAGNNWKVYHRSLGGTKFINLSATTAAGTDIDYWNNTDPTSAVFTVGIDSSVNGSGRSYVAYIFAHDAGGFGLAGTDNVISCGSYTGIAYPTSLDVNVGFEPQFVIIKNSTTVSGWAMWDVMRGMYVVPAANTAQALLLEPNTTAADSDQPGIYPTATGFVVKNGLTSISGSGDTMVYIAIRRGPMKVPTLGTTVFSPVTRTGTGAAASVTGVGFPPDLLWIADRTKTSSGNTTTHDRLRGVGLYLGFTNNLAEDVVAQTVTSYDMDGISVGSSGTVNGNTSPYIDWLMRRAPSFFDEVCYTGTASYTTFTHNLTVAPQLVIIKSRSNGNAWVVGSSLSPSASDYIRVSSTAAWTSGTFWDNSSFVATRPTTTTVTISTDAGVNGSGLDFVAYLFATCAGVSKVGSYTGNGTTQTINCGFTGGARFVLIKRTDTTGDWYVYDTARGMTVLTDPYLLINSTAAEVATLGSVTTVSTGFALDSAILAAINVSAGTYIFLAIA